MADALVKKTLFLFDGDYEKLRDLHPNLAPALVVRTLVRNHILKAEQGKETVQDN